MTKQNIILISADSVRADHCSAFGYDKETTPTLEQLDSVRFTSAYANAPYTAASVPSMLSGIYPLEQGHISLQDRPMIQDAVSKAGYETCVAFSNIQFDRFGYANRFDHRLDFIGDIEYGSKSNPIKEIGRRALNHGGFIGIAAGLAKETFHRFNGPMTSNHHSDSELMQGAANWLEDAPQPFFLWTHLMDTHHAYEFDPEDFEAVSNFEYDPSRYGVLLERAMSHIHPGSFIRSMSEDDRQYLIDCYDASIRHVDKLIGELLESVDLETTTVIFTSDHGEEFWDHGHFGHAGRESIPRPITLYEEMLRIPLLIAGDEWEAYTVENPVQLLDLYRTLTDLVGVEPHKKARGTSLVSILEGGVKKQRDLIAQAHVPGDPVDYRNTENSYRLSSVIRGSKKAIISEQDKNELFNLSTDPLEQFPSSEVDPEDKDLVRSLYATESGSVEGPDSDVRRRLEDLGYM